MSGAGLPVVHVYLDDGTGTFPYDITTSVDLKNGYSVTRGRGNELTTVEPGTLSLTLDNTDGRFTLGSTVIASPSPIKIDQQIRVAVTVGATTSNRFTGFVQSWPVGWPDGSQNFSTCQVTAVDVSARWSRRTLQSMLAETVLSAHPFAYWPLTEPAGATSAENLVPGGTTLTIRNASDTPPVAFGTATTLFDGGTGVAIPPDGQQLAASVELLDGGTGLLIEGFFSTVATSSSAIMRIDSTTGASLLLSTDFSGQHGQATFNPGVPGDGTSSVNITGSSVINDGASHHFGVQIVWNGTTTRTVKLYVDGALQATGSTTGATAASTWDLFRLVGGAGVTPPVAARVAINADVATIATRSATGLAGATERSDLRIDRLIAYEGTVTSTAGDTGSVMVPNQDTTGKTVTDAVQSVVDAEVGLLWINGDGAPQFANKDHVALATSPAMTIPLSSDMIDPGTGFSVDMQQVTNYVTGQREGDDATQVVDNAASIAAHGTYSTTETWLVQSDVDVLSRAQWLVTKYAEPSPRLPTLGLDLLTAEAADQATAIGLDLDSHIRVTGWPTQSPSGSTTDLVVEGYTETLSDTAWALSLNCASWTQQSAGILDDAGYGVLDSMTLGI